MVDGERAPLHTAHLHAYLTKKTHLGHVVCPSVWFIWEWSNYSSPLDPRGKQKRNDYLSGLEKKKAE